MSLLKKQSEIPLPTKTANASQILTEEAMTLFKHDLFASHVRQSMEAAKYGRTGPNEFNQPICIMSAGQSCPSFRHHSSVPARSPVPSSGARSRTASPDTAWRNSRSFLSSVPVFSRAFLKAASFPWRTARMRMFLGVCSMSINSKIWVR